ncbi:hypothetical protein FIBSPDRAFT_52128 [Athelia psychrophila]|uniref:Uncharacterized protein n=1 Tax=Athelia psychrophila TaxID=1759441 RepID=A0A166FHP0_9AGAM|nr:hypothetical protein FIBSPDRAFT_52128 [Fibularhizoctonia sp. CBS 109695]
MQLTALSALVLRCGRVGCSTPRGYGRGSRCNSVKEQLSSCSLPHRRHSCCSAVGLCALSPNPFWGVWMRLAGPAGCSGSDRLAHASFVLGYAHNFFLTALLWSCTVAGGWLVYQCW